MRRNHIIDDLLRPRTVIVLVLVVAATIVLHVLVGDKAKKDVDFGAAIISGAGIIYTVLLTVQSKRASSAARFMERWNDVDFTERRGPAGQVIRGEKKIGEIDTRHIATVLNFFEEMSICIQLGETQEVMLRKFFRSPVIQSAAVFKPWVEERRQSSRRHFLST